MCQINNPQLTNTVESELLRRMQACDSFTALDISNALKAARYPFRHREVSEAVRDVYASGAMQTYGYQRQLIPVVTDGGAGTAEAWLYYHYTASINDYLERNQDALAPVAPQQARDLSDCAAAGALPILVRPARSLRISVTNGVSGSRPARSQNGRRDGALAISRKLLAQLGWNDGDTLTVSAAPGQITIAPTSNAVSPAPVSTPAPSVPNAEARVWNGLRLRLARTKLQLGALSADAVTVEVVNGSLQIAPKTN